MKHPGQAARGLACALVLALAGCGGDGGDQGGQGAARAEGPEDGRPQPAGPPIPVAVAPAERGTIASYYEATASLEVNREAEILARVGGVVRSISAEEGDRVSRGETVLRIDPAEFDLRVRQAEATAATERTRFARLEKMRDQNLVSAEEFEAAENMLAGAEAALELAKLELSYTNVSAPFTGRIVRRSVEVGRTVSSGEPLFLLADTDMLLARVHVPSKEFRNLETDQEVELILDSTDETLAGRISLVSPVIDPATGTIKVTVEIEDYPENTRPGDFVQVNIVTERHEDALLVPKIAVVTDKGERLVFVAADSTAERRVVDVGFEDAEFAEVLHGLAEGEEIVVQGQRSLKHGQPIKRMEALTFDKPKRLQEGEAS